MDPGKTEQSAPEDLEDVMASLLAAPDLDAALAEACASRPSSAGRLRRAVAELRRANLLGPTRPRRGLETIGGFRLREVLGSGGMGVVYRAFDPKLQREVALKILRPELLPFEDLRRRFLREIEAVSRLKHPGIVSVHSAGEDHGTPFFTMELVDGRSLAETIRGLRGQPAGTRRGSDLAGPPSRGTSSSTTTLRLSSGWVDACLQVARMVAEALEHAHQRGIHHRDVKPSNVLIDEHGRARLLDFGLARLEAAQQITKTSSTLGSLPYMPPETCDGSLESYSARQEVYSLGVTLYEMLTLQSPFLASSAEETRRRIVAGEVAPPRRVHPGIGRDVETVCLKAMDRDPARRYATMRELADDLDNLLARRPVRARRAGPVLRALRFAQRHPTACVAGALGFVLLVPVPLGFAVYHKERADAEAELRAEADRTAQRAAALAADLRRRTEEFDLLKVAVLLRTAKEEVETLYPPWPQKSEAIARWLDERWAEIDASRPAVAATVADLEARAEGEGAPRFADPAEQFLHDTLSRLAAELESFEQRQVADARERLAWSRRVGELTDRHPAARHSWDEARRAIASADGRRASALYRRDPPLEISPQTGLVPLGMNPATGLWEFYHLRSASDPMVLPEQHPETGIVEVTAGTGIVCVLIPGGSFLMGAQAEDPAASNYDPMARPVEGPVHEVVLDPFFLARHELTQGQWLRLSGGDNPSVYGPGDWQSRVADPVTLAHPVENVDWHRSLAVMEQQGLTLPTEAQWEYACRAGTSGPWWSGSEKTDLRGAVNLIDLTVQRANIPWRPVETWIEDGYLVHAPVSALTPNPWGLHHALGNVWEWCLDPCLLYEKVPPAPGTGLRDVPTETRSRVWRGGACNNGLQELRASARNLSPPGTTSGYQGLRPARRLDPEVR